MPNTVASIPLMGLPSTTNEGDIHDTIEIDRAAYFRTPGDIAKFRDYAAGKHVRILTDQQSVVLENLLDNDFCDNLCHQIIAEGADRISLLRWDCPDEGVRQFLEDLYTRARVSDFSAETHYNALRDGNYAVAVAWNNDYQRITLQREPWWDGNTGVFIGYDVQGDPLYAVKEWDSPLGRRRLVWFEDRIERYINPAGGVAGGWQQHVLEEDGGQWPLAWTKADGSPLHIPILHFPNAGRGTSIYGTSEIAGGVLGFQDQINDLQYDMTAAGRMTGFQQLFFAGVPSFDEDGNPLPAPAVGPGQVHRTANENAKATVLEAGDIGQLIDLYNAKLRAVSRMTRTPLHAITGGDWPSGEALLRAEMPAVNKAARQIAKFSDCWATVAHRACEIANTFGRAGLDEAALVSAVFSPPERRDPVSKSFVIKNVQPNISRREALRILGYTPAQADEIVAEMIQESKEFGGAQMDSGGGPPAGDTNAPEPDGSGPPARVADATAPEGKTQN